MSCRDFFVPDPLRMRQLPISLKCWSRGKHARALQKIGTFWKGIGSPANVPAHGSPVVSSDLCVCETKRSRRTKSVTKTYIPMLDSSRFTGLIEENVRYRLQNISLWLQPVGLGSILAYNAHIRYTGNSQLFVYCDTSIPLQIKPTGPEVFRRRCDTNTHDDHDCL